MINITRILCPVDFSDASRHALDYAVGIARRHEARITALYVLPSIAALLPPRGEGLYPPIAFSAADLQQYDEALVSFAGRSGDAQIQTQVAQGSVVGEIVRVAAALPADLLVVGTHGRSGFDRLMLGSTTEKLLRKAACPVLTVPPHAPDAAPVGALFSRVLCAVDFSPGSLRALALAESLAGEAGAELCLMHVIEPVSVFEPVVAGAVASAGAADLRDDARQRLQQLIGRDTRAFAETTEVVAAGKASREILREAAARRCDLIVLGAHGALAGLTPFGSTTAHVVREAQCPVVTVR
jgi:nucleotide-binding universal stress UspA family protein